MSAGTVIVHVLHGSDGDTSHHPDRTTHSQVDPPTIYLEKIGTLWMTSLGKALPGVKYELDRLPHGYRVYEKHRESGRSRTDKWLFGHPNHKSFDSPNRFFPHFLHLMQHAGDNTGCPCTVCQTKGGGRAAPLFTGSIPPPNKPLTSKPLANKPLVHNIKPRGRPRVVAPDEDTRQVDNEGTPDVYRNLIDKLKVTTTLDEPIKESMSLDWRAEQKLLPKILTRMSNQAAWIPRVGELVLFARHIPPGEEIRRDGETGTYARYNSETQDVAGPVLWEAGVVGQPAAETVQLKDLVLETTKEYDVNYSGFRVEPLPDPNGKDKNLSLRYKYLPLHHIRPFVFWKEFLKGTEEKDWHPTINHCRKIMSSLSLLGKYRFRGTWPAASIYCQGIYIGSELMLVGDVVRLVPKPYEMECAEVLKITAIKLKLSKLDKAGDNDYDDKHPYNSVVHLTGTGYTSVAETQEIEWSAVNSKAEADVPIQIEGYSQWYAKHDANKQMEIPFSRVLGRCFEADAMMLWLPETTDGAPLTNENSDIAPNISNGLEGIREARNFSTDNDTRIKADQGETWFWGDSRTEVLDVVSFNGQAVGQHDTDRDPSKWRKLIRVLDGVADAEERQELKAKTLEQRLLRGYLAHDSLVRSAFDDTSGHSESLATNPEPAASLRKRNRSVALIDMSDDAGEANGDKRESTMPMRKKQHPIVLID